MSTLENPDSIMEIDSPKFQLKNTEDDYVSALKVFGAVLSLDREPKVQFSDVEKDNSNNQISLIETSYVGSEKSKKSFHSLCYSPSPAVTSSRLNRQEIDKGNISFTTTSKVLQFDAEDKENYSPNIRRKDTKEKLKNTVKSPNSTNRTIEAAKQAKFASIKDKMKEANRLREERRLEKQEAQAFQKDADNTRNEVLRLKRQLATKLAKSRTERKRNSHKTRLAKMENESLFKSKVYRDHKKALKIEEQERKRRSMETRTRLRRERKQGERRMQLARIEEDNTCIQESHMTSIALYEKNRTIQEERRKSYQFRNGDAKRIRELFQEMEEAKRKLEHERFELKWAGENDAEKYRRELDVEKRRSLAARNDQKKVEEEISTRLHMHEKMIENRSIELKWRGDNDALEYKKRMVEEKRKSFAARNKEAKRQREIQAEIEKDEKIDEISMFQLKREGDKDAETYRNTLKEERKRSFQKRNDEGKRIRNEMKKHEMENKMKEHENYELKWAGDNDAKKALEKLEKERRASLAQRTRHACETREFTLQLNEEERRKKHESYELKWDAERDAQKYQKKLALERRESLEQRNREGVRIELEKEHDRLLHDFSEHQSYELRRADAKLMEEYREKIENENRQSLEQRNEQAKRERKIQSQLFQEQKVTEHEDYKLKWEADNDGKQYEKKLQEERKRSLQIRNIEAKRHREIFRQHLSAEIQGEVESMKLKANGDIDATNYKRKLEEERRISLGVRNKDALRQRQVMNELLEIAKEKENESFILKWAGEDDVKKYVEDEKELRRLSLTRRNFEGRCHRDLEKREKKLEIEKIAEEERIKSACQRDVNTYLTLCADRDRNSLKYRRNEAMMQRLQDEKRKQEEDEKKLSNRKLEDEARSDVEQYVEDCKRRKRLSLAFRAKEKRQHTKWERNQEQSKREEYAKEVRYRVIDSRHIKLAEEKERAKKALEALRHAGCSFSNNPFQSLLD